MAVLTLYTAYLVGCCERGCDLLHGPTPEASLELDIITVSRTMVQSEVCPPINVVIWVTVALKRDWCGRFIVLDALVTGEEWPLSQEVTRGRR